MGISPTQLAELVCTRISHDLIGNIGAINNVLEFVHDSNGLLEEGDLNVLDTAISTLSARQQFFRLAFGIDTAAVDKEKLRQICQNYLSVAGNKAYPLDFECNNMSSQIAKVLCLCLMIGAEVCLRGGHIKVTIGSKIIVETMSENPLATAKINIYKQIISGEHPQDNIAQFIQLIYLQNLLGEDVPISLNADEKKMTLTIG